MTNNRVATVILAAGQGTRMKSSRAKVLFEVGGAPMIAWPMQRALALGADPVVVVVGHAAETVEAEVEARFPGKAHFALQTERLGTGHAARVGMAPLADFSGTVVILSGDVPLLQEASLRSLLEEVEPGRCPVAVMTTRLEDPTGYGRMVRDEAQNVVRIVEHKDASRAERAIDEVNAGLYAVDAEFLRGALARLSNDNAQGEYYLTDIVAFALDDGFQVAGLVVDPEEVQGANNRAQLAELEAIANRRTIERHLQAGVTFLDPQRTYVGAEVEIGQDAVVHPGVHLRGRTRVGAHSVLDVGVVVIDAEIGRGVSVHPYSVVEKAKVADGCSVGPFARLRPEANLAEGAKIGNFVEVKKATFGPGAKANHLAYIGDASIGAGANVGAGTITCNYDGVGKHRTQIGEGVFVGSNSTLVAPLSIGKDSYVGAGSVLTNDVPSNALALGRARQAVKEGRASAIRAEAEAKKAAQKKST